MTQNSLSWFHLGKVKYIDMKESSALHRSRYIWITSGFIEQLASGTATRECFKLHTKLSVSTTLFRVYFYHRRRGGEGHFIRVWCKWSSCQWSVCHTVSSGTYAWDWHHKVPPYQHPQASVGDCREIEKDRENFENILAFLTCYNKLNAVVVLLKPNNARLTVAFQFCVLELIFDPPP